MKSVRNIFCFVLLSVFIFTFPSFASAPERVGGVTVSVGETSCRVKWNKVKKCDGYIIYLHDVDNNKTYGIKVPGQNITERKVTERIKRVTRYKVCVAAYNKKKEIGKKSGIVSFKTKIIPPAQPKVKLVSENVKNTVFTWNKCNLAQYYELWRKTGNEESVCVNKKDKLLSCTMGHLKAGTTYIFSVRSVREYKGVKYYSPFSSVKITPFSTSNDQKLASQINTTYAYYGGSDPYQNYSVAALNAYVNCMNNGKPFASRNNYLVWCNTHNYHVYVFTNKGRPEKRWDLIYSWPCIIGRSSNKTPRGIYVFAGRQAYHDYGGVYAEYVSYFTGYGTNAIHSLLYPTQSDYLQVGYMSSAGCIRLQKANAKFVYDNCQGSTFIIR